MKRSFQRWERPQRFSVPEGMRLIEHHVPYPWPILEAQQTLQDALDIAIDYLERTRQVCAFWEVEKVCADVILAAWQGGVRHRIRLANYAIVAIEQRRQKQEVRSYSIGDPF
jgi:hypothetical protein